MKTILVPTDFSSAAEKAAYYALQLAKKTNSDIQLCHAILIPAESPLASQAAWRLEDYNSLKEQGTEELRLLAEGLRYEMKGVPVTAEHDPDISYLNKAGTVTEVVNHLMKERDLNLVVMGMSGGNDLTRFFLGSNSLNTVENADFPILLVPHNAVFKEINKIAFATDMTESDIESINSLASFARRFDAEILIVHITDEQFDEKKYQKKIDSFLNQVTCKINYHKIYYKHIKNNSINKGLQWVADHGQVDMLAMVHREHNFFNNFFRSSHTRKIARHLTIPLMVFPEHQEAGRYFW